MDAQTRYYNALENLPPSGGNGCHTGLLSVANHARAAGIDKEEVAAELRAKTKGGERNVTDREIRDAVNKAYNEDFDSFNAEYSAASTCKIEAPGIDLSQLQPVQEESIIGLSPIVPDTEHTQQKKQLIECVFEPNEWVYIGNRKGTTELGENMRTCENWMDCDSIPGELYGCNPFTGERGKTQDGKQSFRAQTAIADHRNLVVEFDEINAEQQLACIEMLIECAPVLAVYHSGGKSYHALLRIGGGSADEYNARVLQLRPYLVALGADKACLHAARLTRLAGAYRLDKNAYQRLIYVNPDPAGTWETLLDKLQQLDSTPVVDPPETKALPDFCESLLHLPDWLGELQEFIYNRMIYPCRAMAGASALAFFSNYAQATAYVSGPMGQLTLNEYWIVTAKTGSGKESLINSLYKLEDELRGRAVTAARADIQQATPASAQGLHKLLEDNRAQTFMSDEFAEWLFQSSKGKDSHKQGTLGYLMQIYTKGFAWVNVPNAVTNQYNAVKAPRVTIFATSTGERLAEALTGSQADSGSYNRFILFAGNTGRVDKRYRIFKWNPDERLIDIIRYLVTMKPDTPLELTADAIQYFEQFDSKEIEPLKFDDPQLAGRLSEQALKLAGLLALGSGRTEITKDDLERAYDIRLNLYHRAKAYLDYEGGLNGEDETVIAFNQVADLMSKNKRMPMSAIPKYSRKYKALALWQRDKVIDHIERNGIARRELVKGGCLLVSDA